jgi:preprotein translocase subunit SecE
VVLVVTIAVGLILGAFDYGFTHLVDKIFLGQ